MTDPENHALIARIDRLQQRHRWLAVPVATGKRFSADNAGNLAVALAFYGFFSIFPLLLVFTTILGFVLAGDPAALASVRDSVLGHFPVIGDTIIHDRLKGSGPALAIGVALLLYSGLGITESAGSAFDRVWAIPRRKQASWLRRRLRGLMLLAAFGTMFLVACAASGLVSGGLGARLLLAPGVVISVALDFGLLIVSFRVLSSEPQPWRALAPGAALGAVLWELLQLAGGRYIGHIQHSSSAYGTFALVLGILAWLHIGAQMTMFCAELNVVLDERLWPWPLRGRRPERRRERGLSGDPKSPGRRRDGA